MKFYINGDATKINTTKVPYQRDEMDIGYILLTEKFGQKKIPELLTTTHILSYSFL